jgi:hypothetical protein
MIKLVLLSAIYWTGESQEDYNAFLDATNQLQVTNATGRVVGVIEPELHDARERARNRGARVGAVHRVTKNLLKWLTFALPVPLGAFTIFVGIDEAIKFIEAIWSSLPV